jgi:HTH-type transcriptional regulator/antitoxin HigA
VPKKAPQSIPQIVELKMSERKMTQARLAQELGVGKSKVSEIMSGKRNPDLAFVKGVYKILKVDATFLLDHI